jgi:carboxypeptidase C (cathepsin A)
LLWLQGGPGGPGWFGAFGELGNWFIGGNTDDAEPHERCFSWCITNNCLFVDQPVNTGFSFQTDRVTGEPVTNVDDVDYTDTSAGAMSNILDVLTQFYQVFPEVSNNRLVITGESYGGLYTPNLGYLIYEYNLAHPDTQIPFDALAVGDPCINWEAQMPTYPETMYGMGVIMMDEREELRQIMEESISQLKQGPKYCTAAFNTWNQVFDDNGGLGPSAGKGWYARKTGSFNTANVLMGNGPAGFEEIGQFWAKSEAQAAFHVVGNPEPNNATANAINVYNAFVTSGDWCANSSWLYARLMTDAGIDLMIYSSTSDPLLGPPTTEAGVMAILEDAVSHSPTLGKEMKDSYLSTKKSVWFVDSEKDSNPAGYAKCIPNAKKTDNRFCYSVIRNAGHEMPAYQPRAGFDMIERFLTDRAFNKSGEQTIPSCSECSGVGPFAGKALPSCHA